MDVVASELSHDFIHEAHELFKRLNSEHLLLTPNRRLSQELTYQYNFYQTSQQKEAWKTVPILPLSNWLQFSWQEAHMLRFDNHPLLLTEHQELSLWQKIILDSQFATELFDSFETAKLAQKTRLLITQWDIESTSYRLNYSLENTVFHQWNQKFERYCKENNLIEQGSLINYLIPLFLNQTINLPKYIILACFDELTPSIQKLMRSLIELNCKIITYEPKANQVTPQIFSATELNSEIQQMVQWARQQYFSGKKNIGCIVPNLSELRPKIVKIATEYLKDVKPSIDFNISAGQLLTQYPIINKLFHILEFNEPISLLASIELISSPYLLGADSEFVHRLNLENALLHSGYQEFTFQELVDFIHKKEGKYHCPILSKVLESLIEAKKKTPELQPPSHWITHFNEILYLSGWPGDTTLNSEEYQLVNKWQQILDEFKKLDSIYQNITYDQATLTLKKIAASTEFQIQTPKVAIQFLGLLEGAGQTFDSIWICNLTQDLYPSPPDPNPFLPIDIQKQFNLPHSSTQRELEFSQKILQRFLSSAKEIVISYSQQNGDRVQLPSPLIIHYPKYDGQIDNIITIKTSLFKIKEIESYIDSQGPPILQTEKLRGNTELIKNHSECPFQAFAKHRLQVAPYYKKTFGFNYLQRGVFLHSALHLFWKQIKDQKTLLKKSPKDLKKIIATCVKQALFGELPKYIIKKHLQILILEKKRLQNLISEWIEFEKSRQDFECFALEKEVNYNYKGITFKLRVDRIDKLADEEFMLIDYKSTIPISIDWFNVRPDVPQMLLYGIATDLPLMSLMYAQIKTGNLRFQGFNLREILSQEELQSSSDLLLRRKAYRESWQTIINNMLDDFISGNAVTDPKKGITTCGKCQLHSLCRLNSA